EAWNADQSATSEQTVRRPNTDAKRPRKVGRAQLVGIALGLLPPLAAMILGTAMTMAVSGVVGLPALIWLTRPHSRSGEHVRWRHLAVWLLAAWFFGLLISIPFYTPYPRLLLPWYAGGWL